MSDCYVSTQMNGNNVHLDLGDVNLNYGIPWIQTDSRSTGQNAVITYGTDGADYSSESDKGPAAVPLGAPIEGWTGPGNDPTSGDRHTLSLDIGTCTLYELYNTVRTSNGFKCSSSAKFSLTATNYKRPDGWTSADAAGLPILPGLLRYEEASTGVISHATRFTLPSASNAYTYPGNHAGQNNNVNYPPYGTRFRLKQTFSTTPYTGAALAIVTAWKKYGIIFADQGSAMYTSGTTNPNWSDAINQINSQHKINGNQFEAVQSPYTITRGWSPGAFNCNGVSANTNPNWKPTIVNDPTCKGNTVSGSTVNKSNIPNSSLFILVLIIIAIIF